MNTNADNKLLFVDADIGMIERVISNLLDNAIRHTPASGTICITVAPTPSDREVTITVKDTGQGIAKELLPGLLERGSPLRKLATRRSGGLGLLIVNQIIKLHGTHLQATSEVGRGTQISFTLKKSVTS